jgi:catechol 2,3-dioxygenase-like lactoylglutathione lyase family enzyme
MKLGNFSISLNVKDIAASKAFYETLGFGMVGGDMAQGWAIMKNGNANIGLFQGMLEKNTLTFNPGWSDEGAALEDFADIREIQNSLKQKNVPFEREAANGSKPDYFIVIDPDGNPILVDQHVESPKK